MPVYFVDLTDDLYISKEVEYGSVDTSAAIVIKYVTKQYVIQWARKFKKVQTKKTREINFMEFLSCEERIVMWSGAFRIVLKKFCTMFDKNFVNMHIREKMRGKR